MREVFSGQDVHGKPAEPARPGLPRWIEEQLAKAEAAEREEALRKSRRQGETEVHRVMREGGEIPNTEPDGGQAARPARGLPTGAEPMAVLAHGDVCWFATAAGDVHHGKVLSQSATHALIATRAGRFTVPLSRLVPGLHPESERQGA